MDGWAGERAGGWTDGIYRRFGTKSFRHLDDSALDVSAPRRFGTNLKKIPGRFGTKTFRHQGVSVPRHFGTRSVDR